MVASPLQFIADRSLAAARDTFDQIIFDAHFFDPRRCFPDGVA
jgi:hypothetical protein